jgi:hypothetical protein
MHCLRLTSSVIAFVSPFRKWVEQIVNRGLGIRCLSILGVKRWKKTYKQNLQAWPHWQKTLRLHDANVISRYVFRKVERTCRHRRSVHHLRWRAYIHKIKAIDNVCKDLMQDQDPGDVLIAYGNGKFPHATAGHKPTPTLSKWFHDRLQKFMVSLSLT